MKARRRRRELLGAFALGLFGVHCSTLVAGELESVRCTDRGSIGPPACEVGETCGLGRCVACAQAELCGDAVDNDCNGQVDDACGPSQGGGGSGAAIAPDLPTDEGGGGSSGARAAEQAGAPPEG